MADRISDGLQRGLATALASNSFGNEAGAVFARMASARPNSTVVAADFAYSGGTWGTGVTSGAITGTDMLGSITVTTGGATPAANPGVTLTFHDGAFTKPPVVFAQMNPTNATQASIPVAVNTNATQAIFTLGGTAVTALVYEINWVTFSLA
jgi:hypothetical protein